MTIIFPNLLSLQIQATDKDIGKNAEIVYTITSGQNQDHFNLNADNGELRTAKGLDYETIKQYTFKVKAADKGNPSRSGTATVSFLLYLTSINQDLGR